MGSRTIPHVCPHGRTLHWNDLGPDPDDGSVGAETCEECEPSWWTPFDPKDPGGWPLMVKVAGIDYHLWRSPPILVHLEGRTRLTRLEAWGEHAWEARELGWAGANARESLPAWWMYLPDPPRAP